MKTINDNDRLSVLCTELAALLTSGVTLPEAFLLISEQEPQKELAAAYKGVYESTLTGMTATDALESADVFPRRFLRMVGVGESVGAMDKVLLSLAAYYDARSRLSAALRSAVGYPLLLLAVVVCVFVLFITEVLPVFRQVLEQVGAAMPPLASAFLNAGLWLRQHGLWLLIPLIAIAAACIVTYLVPKLRAYAADKLGRLFARTKTGRLITQSDAAWAISLAVAGAKDINEALDLCCRFSEGSSGERAVELCRDMVGQGSSFSAAAEETGLLPTVYCRMIAIGERSGALDSMVAETARRADDDMTKAVARAAARVEPVAVCILTVLVGLLLLSVMTPLIGVMSAL